MTIGQNIKKLRKDRAMQQGELAKMVGTSPNTVSNWERDIFYPSVISLICLADIFDITLDELVGRKMKDGGKHSRC